MHMFDNRNGQSVKMVRFAAMALCSLTMQDTVRSSMVRSGVAEPLCDLHSHLKHHSKDELTVKCECTVACIGTCIGTCVLQYMRVTIHACYTLVVLACFYFWYLYIPNAALGYFGEAY